MQAPEQRVNQVRPVAEVAHEQEQRPRNQHVVRHHAVGALHEEIEHLPARGRRIHAAVGEPGEEHAHSHEREGGGEAEHDAHADQREHHKAQMPVREVSPGHEHDHRDDDGRHQRKPEPEFLAQLHLCRSCCTTHLYSFSISSSLTCTISLSFSTSTSWTSASRNGHSPCLMQMTQRMISTMPCTSTNAPASGMTVLKGYTGGPSAVEFECSLIAQDSEAQKYPA